MTSGIIRRNERSGARDRRRGRKMPSRGRGAMQINVRPLAACREGSERVASPARSSRRVAREISREVVSPRHRTFVLTPPEHLVDDAKAERVVIDDKHPKSGRKLRFVLGFRHRRARRGARHAEETLGEEECARRRKSAEAIHKSFRNRAGIRRGLDVERAKRTREDALDALRTGCRARVVGTLRRPALSASGAWSPCNIYLFCQIRTADVRLSSNRMFHFDPLAD